MSYDNKTPRNTVQCILQGLLVSSALN